MLYVLCRPLLGDALDRIEAFRRVHEPERAKLVPAHITLVFGVTSVSADELMTLASEAVADTGPFAVSLAHAETFEDPASGEHKLILMVDRGADRLTQLHERLYAGMVVTERRAAIPFRPHITVATSRCRDVICAAHLEVGQVLPVHGCIETLSVVALRAGAITPIADLRFGRGS
jgi:2'-5' RNA ligase